MSTFRKEESPMGRRRFLTNGGLVVAASTVTLAACAQPTPAVVTKEVEKKVEVPQEVPAYPWTYVKLDVEDVRKRGHEGYYRGDCGFGAFAAIIEALRDKVGFPFTQIPVDMLGFGAGGVSGWGTTCGALIGASAAINLVTPKDVARALVSELLGWYTVTPFPSQQANDYATSHTMLVKEYKSDKELPQSVSNSPLCHVSVTEWCRKSNIASGAPERAERCGRLAGDVAAHAVELLNANLDGTFKAAFQLSEVTTGCTSCHSVGKEYEMGQFTNGKMECTDCHDPHQ